MTLTWVNSIVGTLLSTAIHRGATGFTAGPGNLIYIVPSTTLTQIITGLEPGTYFFKLKHGSTTGVYGTASTEASAVVT